jgi:hypothetical protein
MFHQPFPCCNSSFRALGKKKKARSSNVTVHVHFKHGFVELKEGDTAAAFQLTVRLFATKSCPIWCNTVAMQIWLEQNRGRQYCKQADRVRP